MRSGQGIRPTFRSRQANKGAPAVYQNPLFFIYLSQLLDPVMCESYVCIWLSNLSDSAMYFSYVCKENYSRKHTADVTASLLEFGHLKNLNPCFLHVYRIQKIAKQKVPWLFSINLHFSQTGVALCYVNGDCQCWTGV